MKSYVKKNAKNALYVCGVNDNNYLNNVVTTAAALLDMDDVEIISHRSPDGDTLGSAAALCRGMRSLGKRVNVVCSDPIPVKYQFLFDGISRQEFEPKHFVSVDIAAPHLMGNLEAEYADKIEVCIDHHIKNSVNAGVKFVDEDSSAVGELIWILLKTMGVRIDKGIAECIFTAITTDTGCFKYSNVTVRTHLIATELIKIGIDCAALNFKLIDEETKEKLALKNMALSTLEYHCDEKCAIITITSEMIKNSGAEPEDMDGVASIPRSVRGVQCGVTMKQDGDSWKISIRSDENVNASELCGRFGGGGHARAAGCKLNCGYDEAKKMIVDAVNEVMGK